MPKCVKGFSEELAGQRVMQLYGNSLPSERIAKSLDVAREFCSAGQEVLDANPGLSRTEALRTLRKSSSELFDTLQGSI